MQVVRKHTRTAYRPMTSLLTTSSEVYTHLALDGYDTGLVWMRTKILALEENLFRMKDQMKFICKTFLGMSVIFCDESNDGN